MRGRLPGARHAEADVAERLQVALLAQQAGVRAVQADHGHRDQRHQQPSPRGADRDLVADQADRGVEQAHGQRVHREAHPGRHPHRAAQHVQRGERESAADQRRGQGADDRAEPGRGHLGQRQVRRIGHRERHRDLQAQHARVVDHVGGRAAPDLRAEPGQQVGRQHDLERHRQQPEDQRDLGEGDGPADPLDVHVDGQLLGQQETHGQQRSDEQQVGTVVEGQHRRGRHGGEDADGEYHEREAGEHPAPHRIYLGAHRWAGGLETGFRTEGAVTLDHPRSSPPGDAGAHTIAVADRDARAHGWPEVNGPPPQVPRNEHLPCCAWSGSTSLHKTAS